MAEPETETIYGSELGRYVDGWADLIEGMGAEAEGIRAIVLGDLKERNMPDVTVKEVQMKEGVISFEKHRDYVITTTFPGVTTTINIARHGSDLFASWRTYIRSTLNLEFMGIYCGVAILLAIVLYHFLQGSPFATQSPAVSGSRGLLGDPKSAMIMLLAWLATTFVIYFWFYHLETTAESSEKQNSSVFRQLRMILLTFLQNHPNIIRDSDFKKRLFGAYFIISIIPAGFVLLIFKGSGALYDNRVALWYQVLSPILVYSIAVFLSILVVAIIAGIIFKQNIFGFILKEPSVFDQEDIAAMSLTVHKTLLRALDTAGIDVSKLRLKGEFRAGRRGEQI